MTDMLLYHLDSDVATLTLNRADTLNSLDLATIDALLSGLDRAIADGARALVLTGSGRAFSSGADLGAGSLADTRPEDIDLGAAMRSHYNAACRFRSSSPSTASRPAVAQRWRWPGIL